MRKVYNCLPQFDWLDPVKAISLAKILSLMRSCHETTQCHHQPFDILFCLFTGQVIDTMLLERENISARVGLIMLQLTSIIKMEAVTIKELCPERFQDRRIYRTK